MEEGHFVFLVFKRQLCTTGIHIRFISS
jgi:hypothetical protein